MASDVARKWWENAVGYQIWPASFMDANNDGFGDINGVISKFDYLQDLGVDLIWLSPVYDSPQHDMGYDIRNYEDVSHKYGSLDDMLALIQTAKERGIRVIMDLVINHTSNEHKWFRESKSSRSNPKTDWYIWRNGKEGHGGEVREPNNWRAAFGGSVWTYAPERDQYYLHLALPEQPDLNWQNAEARQAIYESAVEFWLKKGVDGFRVDVVNFWWKNPAFPDVEIKVPGEPYQPMEAQHIINGPDVHMWIKELRSKISATYGEDILLLGELPATGHDEVMKYISSDSKELDMIFDFDILMADDGNSPLHERSDVSVPRFKQAIAKAQNYLDSASKTWPTAFLESHDYPRSVSHLGPGDGQYHERAAKLLALLNTTLSGTLFIYQGQELGMTNVPASWTRGHFRDKAVLRHFEEIELAYPDDSDLKERVLKGARRFGRDNARTPVQWSNEHHGGFSTVEPWIPINDNMRTINAADQSLRETSVLSFWKSMIQLRKANSDLLVRGQFAMLDSDDKTFIFTKAHRKAQHLLLVCLNLSSETTDINLSNCLSTQGAKVLASNVASEGSHVNTHLQPWEGTAYVCPLPKDEQR